MASKINPILFRLGIQNKNCWYDNFKFKDLTLNQYQTSNQWSNYLNSDEVKSYKENLQSKKRIWSSQWPSIPQQRSYRSYFQLDLNIRYLLKIAFIKINVFIYDIRVEFKSSSNSDVKIQIYTYPINNNVRSKVIEKTRLKLINWFQIYSGLRVKLVIFNRYTFLKLNKTYLISRSEKAKKISFINFRSKNWEKEEWVFEMINSIFLLKSAELLSSMIAYDLILAGKKHLQSLNFIEKRLQAFWKLNQQLENQIKFSNKDSNSRLTMKLKGIKIQIKGRLNGQDRKQKIRFSIGCLALQDLNTFVDFSSNKVLTRYGVLGLKVWITFVNYQSINTFKRKIKKKQSKKLFKLLSNELPWIL